MINEGDRLVIYNPNNSILACCTAGPVHGFDKTQIRVWGSLADRATKQIVNPGGVLDDSRLEVVDQETWEKLIVEWDKQREANKRQQLIDENKEYIVALRTLLDGNKDTPLDDLVIKVIELNEEYGFSTDED